MKNTKTLMLTAIGFTALLTSMPLKAQNHNQNSQDEKFMQTAAKGGMMEVRMGQLGEERGASEDVKNFSKRLVADHTKANQELMMLARQKGVNLPPDDAQMVASMPFANKRGNEFDRNFAKEAVEDHRKDIAEFEKEAKSGGDADVRNWAKQTLPTLRAHLSAAEALQK
jgi:putative membrane protein